MKEERRQELRQSTQEVNAAWRKVLPVVLQAVTPFVTALFPAEARFVSRNLDLIYVVISAVRDAMGQPKLGVSEVLQCARDGGGSVAIGNGTNAPGPFSVAVGPEVQGAPWTLIVDMMWLRETIKQLKETEDTP